MVTLGEQKGEDSGALAAAAEQRRELEDEIDELRKRLRQAAQREQELEADVVLRRQEVGILQRKLAQANNSAAVVGVVLGIVVVALLGILLTR